MDRRNPIPDAVQRRITKFYVTNLPDRCSGNDLAGVVREFGVIFDIYIARKRDRFRNWFGFVSLLGVKNKEHLGKNLNKIRMGSFALKFNVAMFVLEEGEIKVDYRKQSRQTEYVRKKTFVGTSNGREGPKAASFGDRSFSDILVGRNGNRKDACVVQVDQNLFAFSGLHGRAILARMIDFEALENINVILKEISPAGSTVQFLGWLTVLLAFSDNKAALEVLEAARNVLGRFSKLELWEGQSWIFERLAWLKIQGIPLHLLRNEVVDSVAGLFGKLIHRANISKEEKDLSFEYVGVLVESGKRVDEAVNIQWNGRLFPVWVMEDSGAWIPDFLNKDKDVSEQADSSDDSSDHVMKDDGYDAF